MKIERFDTDREKNPLMKDLHDLAVKHQVYFVAVAYPDAERLKTDPRPHTYFIDRRDDTKPETSAVMYEHAGVLLIQTASAAREFAAEQAVRKLAVILGGVRYDFEAGPDVKLGALKTAAIQADVEEFATGTAASQNLQAWGAATWDIYVRGQVMDPETTVEQAGLRSGDEISVMPPVGSGG